MLFMYKLFGGILIAVLITGCITRTEYGRRRLTQIGSHRTEVNSSAFSIIDTSKLYQIVSAVALADHKPLISLNKVYLKFYANGKLGIFYNYRPEDISSLNPKRADVGYYRYKDNQLEINTFFEHPQGGGWVKELVMKSHRDTIQSTAQRVLTKYKMLDLSPEFLIYKPDW
jgi:hypothetical protein